LGETIQKYMGKDGEIEYLEICVTKYMYVYFSVIKTVNSTLLFPYWIESFRTREDKFVAHIQTPLTAYFAPHRQTVLDTEYKIAGEMRS
jgi:hypothetical protein